MLTRFAPSPTGFLHVGNIRTALINYLFTKSNSGQFILRIDDTDDNRSDERYSTALQEDLLWLGIKWDLCFKQSSRLSRYREILNYLIDIKKVYPCYESVEELEIKRKLLLNNRLTPIYDRASLKLTDEQIKQYEAQGIRPYFRFKLDYDTISWDDELKGKVNISLNSISDPILLRANGFFTYMLPSTVDDIDYKITHIVRGEDHITNTAIQIQIARALGGTSPIFMHLPLLKIGNSKISKRSQEQYSIRELRKQHLEPLAINSYLAKLGTAHSFKVFFSMEDLIKDFQPLALSQSNPQFDEDMLKLLNAKLIQNLPFICVKDKINIQNFNENFWDSIKANINTLDEVYTWWEICKTPIQPITQDKELLEIALDCLPEGEFNEDTFNNWVEKIRSKTTKTGVALFLPLRLALTASRKGPELAKLLPLIGRKEVMVRLGGN